MSLITGVQHTYELYGITEFESLPYPIFNLTKEEKCCAHRLLNHIYYGQINMWDDLLYFFVNRVLDINHYPEHSLYQKLLKTRDLVKYLESEVHRNLYGYPTRLWCIGLPWFDCRRVWLEKLIMNEE